MPSTLRSEPVLRRGLTITDKLEKIPIRIKEVEAAQQQIIATVRQLQAEGTLNVAGSSGEQYVT